MPRSSNQSFLDEQFALNGEVAFQEPSLLDLAGLSPGAGKGHLDQARSLVRGRDFEGAKDSLLQTLAKSPHSPDARALLGAIYLYSGDAAAAMPHLVLASELVPEWAEVRRLCGEAAWRLGQSEVANAYLQRALALNQDWPEVTTRLGQVRLKLGEYSDGWALFESRWQCPAYHRADPRDRVPRWDGRASLEGKAVVIVAEQGLNELLQFVRYASLLRRRGAKVIVTCPGDLVSLVETVPGVIRAIPFGTQVPAVDFQIPMLSLPYVFGTMLGTIPAEVPYLSADDGLRRMWRERLTALAAPATRRIGVLWRGYPGEGLPSAREVPLELLRSLWEIAGVSWFSLATGDAAGDLMRQATPLIDLSAELDSADMFAAVVSELDAVVAIDSAVTHLAGAMGRRGFVMLNSACDFRWPGISEQTPWYSSLRLFRQDAEGNWPYVTERMARAISTWARSAAV